MLRITELRLPLAHPPQALRTAIAERLGIAEGAIRNFNIFKRSHDARKKSALTFIYTVDVETAEAGDEAALLAFCRMPDRR